MKVSIIGLGWVGAPLAHSLVALGHQVSGTTRSTQKVSELRSFGISVEILDKNRLPTAELLDCDVCVLNIPPFEGQLHWFKQWHWNPKTHLILLSSTSVYGNLIGAVTEKTPPVPDTENAKILFEEENWIKQKFSSHTVLRLSGLLDEERHPGKFLSGRLDVKGKNHPVNLIHRKDVVGFIELVIQKKISGETFNVSSDEGRSKKNYYSQFAKSKNLPLPQFDESDESSGKKVVNEKMKQLYKLKVELMP